ncbi:MAG: phenylalanine--tRNA ligase beta subunit-related protein [Candidatus Burarchaeum sp.]|nr:phenylalanine--tRNA ligase beta subunit-related protein [Candidatus Burarchaeum sp.]MDO8339623.1 phenylalanine--tRNA ligase beta subunit-related protein [Candidatus Burarchaeum sp.]
MAEAQVRRMEMRVDDSSRSKLRGLDIAHIMFRNVQVLKTHPLVDEAIRAASKDAGKRFGEGRALYEDPVLKGIRALFSQVGLDPTKERPSGEALIKRVLDGKGVYRINTVVDANNAVSIRTGAPCGVYDTDKFEGDAITFSVGGPGTNYDGIGGQKMNGDKRILTSDSAGIFGGPTADSKRTCITLDTKGVLMLIYFPSSASRDVLMEAMKNAIGLMEKVTSGKAEYSEVFSIQ